MRDQLRHVVGAVVACDGRLRTIESARHGHGAHVVAPIAAFVPHEAQRALQRAMAAVDAQQVTRAVDWRAVEAVAQV